MTATRVLLVTEVDDERTIDHHEADKVALEKLRSQARAIAETAPHGDWPCNDFFGPSGYPVVAAAMMWLTAGRVAPAVVLAAAVALIASTATASSSAARATRTRRAREPGFS